MPKRDPKVRLLHMRDYARKAVAMSKGRSRHDIDADEMLRLALTHLVELVGEAASQVPPETQAQYPQLPWPEVISTRHRLIHGYDFVDYDILWDTISHDLPGLIAVLDGILEEEPDRPTCSNARHSAESGSGLAADSCGLEPRG